MMTGNTIKMATSIGEWKVAEALHFGSLVLCYSLGNTIYRGMVHYHNEQTKPHLAAKATVSPLIVALLFLSDLLFDSATKSLRHVIPLALGFGMLNAATMDSLGGTITFAMTGHIKTISQGLSDWLFHSDPQQRRLKSAVKSSARVVGFFVLGCIAGTFLANLGNQQFIEATGMTLPSSLIGEPNLPIYTVVGLLSTLLLHLQDRPYPSFLRDLWSDDVRVDTRINNQNTPRAKSDKVQLSVNFFGSSRQ